MRLVQINAYYGYLSTGLIVQDIANAADRAGIESYVAYQQAVVKPQKGYKIGNKLDRKMHALHARIFGKQAYASKTATMHFLRWLDSNHPDIVHLHNLHSNYINLNMLCQYLAYNDISTVITLHDCWYFTGKCSHYISIGCNKWQKNCGNCPQLKSEVPSLFIDNTSNVLNDKISHLNAIKKLHLVGCSNWIAEEARHSLIKPAAIHTIYNGVDTSIFCPHNNEIRKRYSLDSNFVIMGMANKWLAPINRDAVDYFFSHLSGNEKILIVGCNGEDEKKLKKYNCVITIGYIHDRKELSDLYCASDVFVNLTHADTLPTVNMESICCGTPVVTYDACGSPELVDKECGDVVAVGDYVQLWESVRRINENGMKYDVSMQATKFNKDTCYNQYIDLYNQLG